jgi:hypothetical protein
MYECNMCLFRSQITQSPCPSCGVTSHMYFVQSDNNNDRYCTACKKHFYTNVSWTCPKCKTVLKKYTPPPPPQAKKPPEIQQNWPTCVYRGDMYNGIRRPHHIVDKGFILPWYMVGIVDLKLEQARKLARVKLIQCAKKGSIGSDMEKWKGSKNKDDGFFISTGKSPRDAYDHYLFLYKKLLPTLYLSDWKKIAPNVQINDVHLYLDKKDDVDGSDFIAVIKLLAGKESGEVMFMTPINTEKLYIRSNLDINGCYVYEELRKFTSGTSVANCVGDLQKKLKITG